MPREDIEVAYEWVDPSTEDSSTDVVATTIGANLACALRYLREKDAVFTIWVDAICIDQVNFMEGLMQPERLRARILLWAEEEIKLGLLPKKSGSILEAVLYRGELPRGEADTIVGTGERQARRIVSALEKHGVLESESPRGPLRLTFPAALGHRWMPGLFPEKSEDR